MLDFPDIAKIFEDIELMLIKSLRRNLSRHKEWEKNEGFEWSAWQAEKLRNLERFRKENRAILGEYTDVIDAQTRELMTEQFAEGERLAAEQLRKAEESSSQDYGDFRIEQEPIVTAENFFGVNEEKMQALIEDITTLEKNCETAALRMVDDVYRQTVNKVQLAMGSGSMSLEQAIDSAVNDFLEKGINCIVYSDGRRVNVADYVRMALRTTSARAKLQGEAKHAAEQGYDTVIITQHNNCSETCLPWQGRVYIDDVFTPWTGEIDGENGKSNYCGKWFPLLSSAICGGLFHPNCRHTMHTYCDGRDALPPKLDENKVRENAKLRQKQRRLENAVRKAKRKVMGMSDIDNVKQAKNELREAQKKLRAFVNAHTDVLKRNSNSEKVYESERRFLQSGSTGSENGNAVSVQSQPDSAKAAEINISAPKPTGSEKVYKEEKILDKSEKSGIIELGSDDVALELQRYGRNKETLVNKAYIDSGEYRRKFDNATDNEAVNKTLYDSAKTALKHRSGTVFEDMYWINEDTGKIIYSVTDSTDERAIIYTESIRKAIKDKNNIITLHTHPSSMPPSISDFNSCYRNNYKKGFIACHDGKVFAYTSNQKVSEKLYNLYIGNFIDDGYDEYTAQLKALEKIMENHNIDFREVLL